MSFANKQHRQACWLARDLYWSCLDTQRKLNPPLKSVPVDVNHNTETINYNEISINTNNLYDSNPCMSFKKALEENCPQHWIKHFERKRQHILLREKIDKGLHNIAEPVCGSPKVRTYKLYRPMLSLGTE